MLGGVFAHAARFAPMGREKQLRGGRCVGSVGYDIVYGWMFVVKC